MPSDHYRTLTGPVEFRHKIQRSEFLGLAFPLSTDEEFFARLQVIEKRYFDATHHCWAFRLFSDGEGRQRSSDAGEPSGSAGKPILSALEGARLHDAAVVVVRWFGGVKLGTGGLARAYRQTALETLRRGAVVDRYLFETFNVVVPHEMLNAAYRLVRPPDVILTGQTFADEYLFRFDVRRSVADAFAQSLIEKRFRFDRTR